MTPVKDKHTNSVLKAPKGQEDTVIDLPVTNFKYSDGTQAVESCWQLSKEELEQVKKTGKVYFVCLGVTHPPIYLGTKSELD